MIRPVHVSRIAPDAEIGGRIQVMGNSGSGKSTLAARLAEALGAPFVELDALNWLPGWVGLNQTDPDRFERRIREATRGERWVVAGSYERFSRRILWPRLDTVVWLDLPLRLLVWRFLRRSWQRSRSGELVWGTNREWFWRHLLIWRHDSLLAWIITQHRRKRRNMAACVADPRWAHIRFVRLTSPGDVEAFAASVTAAPSDLP
ncbi:AAA family ATPase [Candidatus Palauibacter soopunensis]|uniref:AAA family ATPase n=1 Tax=Candidatus Palauibacter soopunensis TaxID=3056739 RepID=UPI002385758B|nr:AAA family ATPase [Candidatus Palauibacter soopunensis]MDE2879241.1 adenylate kinase [Candidatus Palauibacter soopunensis]